ncbi:MAG: hypothetical protein M1832_002922 [Thelocarpon impressellum]|nr:MAG: hypothetical protein M1832_002922 [Thelocarpon impressellum]
MATQLVPLPEVERLSPAVIRILGGNPGKVALPGPLRPQTKSRSAGGTNTYLLGTGPFRILIDTGEGVPSWIDALGQLLTSESATITAAILTHHHADHVGGVPDLLALSPSTKIYKHPPAASAQLPLLDAQTLSVPGATLRAAHTPGHTPDHLALHLLEEDALFTGDAVLGHGTAVFDDLALYLASLARMRTLFKGRAYPGHGAVIGDGPARVEGYIRHRQEREQQVLDVLGSSHSAEEEGWTPTEIVGVVYREVPVSLHVPAEGGVVQVLRKLEGEDRVVVESGTGRWRINGRAAL